jgi:1,4-dihydroxy-2-naphthoate polyprenyltransferase
MKNKIVAWLKLARLRFYPLALAAYSIGAASAFRVEHQFDRTVYIVGFLCIFFLELCTVFCNEYFDLPTDSLNKTRSLFTGGSRMVVSGKITLKELRTAVLLLFCLIFISGYFLSRTFRGSSASLVPSILLLGLILGPGYTVPPLKFSYRGLGEFVVALTFSPYLILSGYSFQTGRLDSAVPWLLSIPLFLAILQSIILAGIPDYESDLAFSKKLWRSSWGRKKRSFWRSSSFLRRPHPSSSSGG